MLFFLVFCKNATFLFSTLGCAKNIVFFQDILEIGKQPTVLWINRLHITLKKSNLHSRQNGVFCNRVWLFPIWVLTKTNGLKPNPLSTQREILGLVCGALPFLSLAIWCLLL